MYESFGQTCCFIVPFPRLWSSQSWCLINDECWKFWEPMTKALDLRLFLALLAFSHTEQYILLPSYRSQSNSDCHRLCQFFILFGLLVPGVVLGFDCDCICPLDTCTGSDSLPGLLLSGVVLGFVTDSDCDCCRPSTGTGTGTDSPSAIEQYCSHNKRRSIPPMILSEILCIRK